MKIRDLTCQINPFQQGSGQTSSSNNGSKLLGLSVAESISQSLAIQESISAELKLLTSLFRRELASQSIAVQESISAEIEAHKS